MHNDQLNIENTDKKNIEAKMRRLASEVNLTLTLAEKKQCFVPTPHDTVPLTCDKIDDKTELSWLQHVITNKPTMQQEKVCYTNLFIHDLLV